MLNFKYQVPITNLPCGPQNIIQTSNTYSTSKIQNAMVNKAKLERETEREREREHYENLPMQYTEIFKVVKNENIQ